MRIRLQLIVAILIAGVVDGAARAQSVVSLPEADAPSLAGTPPSAARPRATPGGEGGAVRLAAAGDTDGGGVTSHAPREGIAALERLYDAKHDPDMLLELARLYESAWITEGDE